MILTQEGTSEIQRIDIHTLKCVEKYDILSTQTQSTLAGRYKMPKSKLFVTYLLLTCILTTFALSACSDKETSDATSDVSSQEASTNENSADVSQSMSEEASEESKTQLVTKNDYLNALYGYYVCNDYYYYISEETFEKKHKTEGTIDISDDISEIDVKLADNGVNFNIIFYRNGHMPVSMSCDSNGNITDDNGENFTEISKEEYESVEPSMPDELFPQPDYEDDAELDSPTDDYDQGDYGDYIGGYDQEYYEKYYWYLSAFDMTGLRYDLRMMDNLLAVGKVDEAAAQIQVKIFDKLDVKVDEFIKKRQYWQAYNYVAMFNVHLSGRERAECGEYYFLEDYFEEIYTSNGEFDNGPLGNRSFANYIQKYYIKIYQARKTDTNYISKEQCLYKLNEYFLNQGYGTKTGLLDGKFMYFTEILDNNFSPTEYYIVCPYTDEIFYLPVHHYFMDRANFYEGMYKEYM